MMLTPQQVACSFIPAFFERLASNPADLADMYSSRSTLAVVDFEYGMTESSGAEVPKTLEQWAHILQGCDLSVESYFAAPLYSGVSVYTTIMAESKTTRHYFQFVTILESFDAAAYDSEGYFIRHQIVIRPGSTEKEQEVEDVEVVPQVEDSPEQLSPATDTIPEAEAEAEEPEEKDEVNSLPDASNEKEPESNFNEPEAAATSSPQELSTKPKTWASLAGVARKGEHRQPMKVTFHGNNNSNNNNNNSNNGEQAVQHKPTKPAHVEAQQQESTTRPHPRPPRQPSLAVGDRVMFNIDHDVSDEEVKTALGELAEHVVSLRNNSANGHVFLDFSDKVRALDLLRATPLVIGAGNTRVNVYRQRTRQ